MGSLDSLAKTTAKVISERSPERCSLKHMSGDQRLTHVCGFPVVVSVGHITGQAEVGYLQHTLLVDEHVAGGQVTVDDLRGGGERVYVCTTVVGVAISLNSLLC